MKHACSFVGIGLIIMVFTSCHLFDSPLSKDGNTAAAKPDVYVASVAALTDESGVLTSVHLVLGNAGAADAVGVGYLLCLSADQTPSLTDDTIVYRGAVDLPSKRERSIDLGAESDIYSWLLSHAVACPSEPRYIGALVDFDNLVQESEESNNSGITTSVFTALEDNGSVCIRAAGTGRRVTSVAASTLSTWSHFAAVTTDAAGNVYIAGELAGAGDFDFGGGVTCLGRTSEISALVAMYDANGVAQWAHVPVSQPSNTHFTELVPGVHNTVYVVGNVEGSGTVNFGGNVTATGSARYYNGVLVEYGAGGEVLWATSPSSSDGQDGATFDAAGTDHVGNTYVAGHVGGTGSYDFGDAITVTAPSTTYVATSHALVVKYDGSHIARWARSIASVSDYAGSFVGSAFAAVAADTAGEVYAAGYVHGTETYDFGDGVTVAGTSTGKNLLLVKYGPSGAAVWARSVVSGSADSVFSSLAVDGSGNVFVVGSIHGTGKYGFGNGITATGTSADDNLVAVAYDADGAAQWAATVTSGTGKSVFSSVAIDSSDNVYAIGHLWGTASYGFGGSFLLDGGTSQNDSVLLVKYDSSGAAQWAKTATTPGLGGSVFYGVAASPAGEVYAVGDVMDIYSYDFGAGAVVAGTDTLTNAVLIGYAQ